MGALEITNGKLKAAREPPHSAPFLVRFNQYAPKEFLRTVPLLVLECLLCRFVKLFQFRLGWDWGAASNGAKNHQECSQQKSLRNRQPHRSFRQAQLP